MDHSRAADDYAEGCIGAVGAVHILLSWRAGATVEGSVVARQDRRRGARQHGVEGDDGSAGSVWWQGVTAEGGALQGSAFDIDKYCLGGDSSHILCSSVLCSWPRLTAGMNTPHELASGRDQL